MAYPMSPTGSAATVLIPFAFVALAIFRNLRTRRLRVERLWLAPVLLIVAAGAALRYQPPSSLIMVGVDVMAVALGAGVGWWRGRFTTLAVDPATHQLTSKASPAGLLLVLAVMGLRFGLRSFASANAGVLHVSVIEITDTFLLLAVGIVCAHRLELALRATRLLKTAPPAP